MAVPKRRTSRSKQGHRRSHHHAKPPQAQQCPQCGALSLPHRVCGECGFYQGREIFDVKEEGK